MDDFYKALLQMSPQGQGLLGLAEPERPTGAGAYLRQLPGVMPGLFNFDSPQIIERPEMYTPLIEQPTEAKEPEVLRVDTGFEGPGQGLHPAVAAFLDNEAKTPGARDARIGNINAMLSMATPFGTKGPVMGLLGALLNATNPGQKPAPVTTLDPTTYSPGRVSDGVSPGFSVGTPEGFDAIGDQGADPESGSYGISVI